MRFNTPSSYGILASAFLNRSQRSNMRKLRNSVEVKKHGELIKPWRVVSTLTILLIVTLLCWGASLHARNVPTLQNPSGLRLLGADENNPALAIVLPGYPATDRSIDVIFPEHVTAKRHGSGEPEHLYLFAATGQTGKPVWRRTGNSIEYERDLDGGIHFLAKATLEDNGVLFHYEFLNHSDTAYDMIYAATDPRLTGVFHDVRLERTYVHQKNGFDLLASETPARLTMPLGQWLPSRYLASYTWPVPSKLVERRTDGITYYNKARSVDEPMVATISSDGKWVVASFTRTTGNVWSNPELTCQHVDPETSVGAGQTAATEVKILVFKGSLDDALRNVRAQRKQLK